MLTFYLQLIPFKLKIVIQVDKKMQLNYSALIDSVTQNPNVYFGDANAIMLNYLAHHLCNKCSILHDDQVQYIAKRITKCSVCILDHVFIIRLYPGNKCVLRKSFRCLPIRKYRSSLVMILRIRFIIWQS